MGAAAPFMTSLLSSCANVETTFYPRFEVNFSGKVLIIGAGTAGLIAGHVLRQHGIDFQIIEASSVYGGRVKATNSFADFPIDLGAEWIHTNPSVLAKLLNDPNTNASIDIIKYAPDTLYLWRDNKLRKRNLYTNFYQEYKFKSSTWHAFFEQYIVPNIADKITYNSPVSSINYAGNQVEVTNTAGTLFNADRVIVTVPLNILKNGSINFQPDLPQAKWDAFNQIEMPDGIKVFMEFSERFYPDLLFFGNVGEILSGDSQERIYYNAAFRKDSVRNILGLFTVGANATVYANQPTEAALIKYMLTELDTIFDGKASRYYQKHVVQNWSKEPYIQGAYTSQEDENLKSVMREAVDNKIYFAGEAYAVNHSTVHGAGESAYSAAEILLKNQ
jgi:monoamine oxidase